MKIDTSCEGVCKFNLPYATFSSFLVAESGLLVRAFACRRTNRGDNIVGSAVWRLARTTQGNLKGRIFIANLILLVFLGVTYAVFPFNNKNPPQTRGMRIIESL